MKALLAPFAAGFQRLRSLAAALDASLAMGRGWRAAGAAFAAGAVAALAMPPAQLWLLFYPCLMLLLMLLWRAPGPAAGFRLGWCFAAGFFLISLYWVGNALRVFSPDLWWAVPLVAVALPAALAVFYGLATLFAVWFQGRAARSLAFVAAWALADWLRGVVFTGFPWNLAGHAWAGSDRMIQAAALGGIHGLGLLLLASVVLAALAAAAKTPRGRLALMPVAVAIPLLVWGYGDWRLDGAPPVAVATGPGLRLVQPSIPQREKWDRALALRNFETYLRLSQQDRPGWVRAVIWPESAAAFFLMEQPRARQMIAAALPPGGLLLTGTIRRDQSPLALYNSAVVVDTAGEVAALYDKAHLVPFGEYMPLSAILPFQKLAGGMMDYAAGPGPRTLFLPGLPPVSPLICYEAIFPGRAVNPAQRPDWLVNLTNDAWYGRTAGPYQHLAMVRLRAVEEGLPLVRAANSGISAVFDAYGRETARLGLEESGVLDVRLPPPLASPTLFARTGDAPLVLLLALLLGGMTAWRLARGRFQPSPA